MTDRGGELRFFQGIHVRIVIKIFISIPINPYEHQICETGTFTGVASSETNQAGAGNVITSSSNDKLKTFYLHYQTACGYQTWQNGNLPK